MTDKRPEDGTGMDSRIRYVDIAARVSGSHPGYADDGPGDGAALVGLAALAQPVEPPDGLFEAVSERIDALPAAPVETLRAGEGQWVRWADNVFKRMLFGEKVWTKLLHSNAETGESVYLMRCEPGAWIPAHKHPRDEHVFVIEGEFVVGNTVVKAGDYHFSPAGSRHGKITSPTGCLSLIHD